MILVGGSPLPDLAYNVLPKERERIGIESWPWQHFDVVDQIIWTLPEFSVEAHEGRRDASRADAKSLEFASLRRECHVAAHRRNTATWDDVGKESNGSPCPTEARAIIESDVLRSRAQSHACQ